LGKEADVGKELHDVSGCRQLLLIHVDAVAESLEGLEADADRQNDVHCGKVQLVAQRSDK
jgi:hypothetical protein